MAEELRRVDTPLGLIEYFLTVKSVKNINLRIRRHTSRRFWGIIPGAAKADDG